MIKVKLKTLDGDIAKNDSDNQEAYNVTMEIKQEPELVLESELTWFPTKLEDEQQEYYQQYRYVDGDKECGKYILPTIKSDETEYEEYSIKYIGNEGENLSDEDDGSNDRYDNDDFDYVAGNNYDKDSDDDSDDSEYFNVDMDTNSYMELTKNLDISQETEDTLRDLDDKASGSTKPTYQQSSFLNWLCSKYLQYVCPVCEDIFESNKYLDSHINKQHKNEIDDTKSSNYFTNTSQTICKQCQKPLKNDVALLIHSMRHSATDTLELFMCNICRFKSSQIVLIQRHIIKEHPDIVELFENLKIHQKEELHKCPLCPAIFESRHCLRFHFVDNHPKEHNEIFTFPCHLCQNNFQQFDDVQDFLKHLLEEHNLKDYKLINFKIFAKNTDVQNFFCTKCFKIFTKMDLMKFVRHYLEHDNNSFRSCKTCHRRFSFKYRNWYHMCSKLFNKYQARAGKTIVNIYSSSSSKEIKELTNWKEFEDYMKHVCPFCNKEFEKLHDWQMHLRNTHRLDTLKGLKMKQIAEDTNKLQCNICCTLVINKSVEVHTHCFQHLPFKPYKCEHCSLTLANYKVALAHVLNKCQIEKNRSNALRESFEIICPLCNEKMSSSEDLLKHYSNIHNDFLNYYSQKEDNSLLCNICELQLPDNKNLYRSHVLQHFDQKSHKCLKCFQSFTRSILHRHVRYHFATPINKANGNSSLKNSHLQTFNNSKTQKVETKKCAILNEFSEFITYACPECNESLTNQQSWSDHIDEKHDFFNEHNLSMKDPIDGSFKCIHCPLKVSTGLKDRQKHKLTHMPYKSFICAICFHRCNSLGVLYGHLRRVHFAKGSYECPICSEVCTTRYERSEHIKTTHPKSEWPETMCLICYKIVELKTSIKEHIQTHDINRPKFECEYCGVKLIALKDFNAHKARHEKILETEKSRDTNNTKTSLKNYKTENTKSNIEDAEQMKKNTSTQDTANTNLLKQKVNKRKSYSRSSNNKKNKKDTKQKT